MTHDFGTGILLASLFWAVLFVLNVGVTLRRLHKFTVALRSIRAANEKLGESFNADIFQRDARIACLEHVLHMHGIKVEFIGTGEITSGEETLH